ncbi:MAG: ABC transporter permease [Saprospiraceae bacterium]|nr:ABC transporter permease [Saprospiraceae bacterium]
MFKFWIAFKKEINILLNDRVGLALMFIMPLLLVVLITIIQDSSFKMVNEHKVSILVVNQDEGKQGGQLISKMEDTGFFKLEQLKDVSPESLKKELLKRKRTVALLIPNTFTDELTQKANALSQSMVQELGMGEDSTEQLLPQISALDFYYDPVLPEAYTRSVGNMIYSLLATVESELMIDQVYVQMGMAESSSNLKEQMFEQRLELNSQPITRNKALNPNPTQHNVPAWTIFAMFFMVNSLGNSIIKERTNGSFIRLKTMPTSFFLVLSTKILVYLLAAMLQVVIVFSIGVFVFPYLDLPQLVLPTDWFAFFLVVFFTGLAAVSYALMIGTTAKTQEQANGFGAVSIVILAAIGGIWVPTFMMPEYLQILSNVSPLRWCLEGFYVLFLRGCDWAELQNVLVYLTVFIGICFFVSYWKLRMQKII